MKNVRLAIIMAAIIIIGGQLSHMDFGQLDWESNSAEYNTIIGMVCVIGAMILSFYASGKKSTNIKK